MDRQGISFSIDCFLQIGHLVLKILFDKVVLKIEIPKFKWLMTLLISFDLICVYAFDVSNLFFFNIYPDLVMLWLWLCCQWNFLFRQNCPCVYSYNDWILDISLTLVFLTCYSCCYVSLLNSGRAQWFLWYYFNKHYVIGQVDDANAIQQKEYAMALSIVLTLQVPQVIDKLDDILR